MKQDGRRDQRQPISLKVRFKSATLSDFIEKHAGDVSRGGIFIKTKKPMPVGTLLKFEFKLKDDQDLINGVGRVVWARTEAASDSEPPGMGIKFIKIDEPSRGRIIQIVDGSDEKDGISIDEPFGDETNASFPRSLLEAELAAQQSQPGPEEAGPIADEKSDSAEKVAPPPAREKPPIGVPVPASRSARVSVPGDAKKTMLGMAAVPVPRQQVDAGAPTMAGIPGVVPVPTSARSTRPDLDTEQSATAADDGAPAADIGFKPGPKGVSESGILHDISQAIDSALTRRVAAPTGAEGATAETQAADHGQPEVPSEGEPVDREAVGDSGTDLDEPAGDLPSVPPLATAATEPPGAAVSVPPQEPVEEEEEEEEDDIRAHEAVVISQSPSRTSMAPGKPVVEATRAGADEKSPGGSSRLGLMIAAIIVLVLAGAAAWWFLLRGGSTEDLKQLIAGSPDQTPQMAQPAAPKPAPPVVTPAPEPVQQQVVPSAPVAPAPVETVDFSVVTEPAGARLFVDGKRQTDETPVELPALPIGREVELTTSLFGYRSQTVRVAPTAESPEVRLSLKRGERLIHLEGSPPAASVYINGKLAGKVGTTATVERVGPGLSYMARKSGFTAKGGKLGPADWREKDGAWTATIRVELQTAPKEVVPAAPKKTAAPAPSAPKVEPAAEKPSAPKAEKPAPKPAPKPAAPKKKAPPKKAAPKKPADDIDENPF